MAAPRRLPGGRGRYPDEARPNRRALSSRTARLPADFLALSSLSDGVTANGITVYSLTDVRRVPLALDDDFFAVAEVDGEAIYLGVRGSDGGSEPPLFAMRHDDPGAVEPVGRTPTELVDAGYAEPRG